MYIPDWCSAGRTDRLSGEEILTAVYGLVRWCSKGAGQWSTVVRIPSVFDGSPTCCLAACAVCIKSHFNWGPAMRSEPLPWTWYWSECPLYLNVLLVARRKRSAYRLSSIVDFVYDDGASNNKQPFCPLSVAIFHRFTSVGSWWHLSRWRDAIPATPWYGRHGGSDGSYRLLSLSSPLVSDPKSAFLAILYLVCVSDVSQRSLWWQCCRYSRWLRYRLCVFCR